MSGDVDVAIVGAGAAGLAAALRARDFGLSFVVLEAKDRIGGRAFTDTETFGTPWDRGAHWLHSAAINPLTRVAEALGQPYLKRESFRNRNLHLGSRWASADEREDCNTAMDAAFEAVDELGAQGLDVPAARALDPSNRWYRLIEHVHEAISAFPPERISTLDLYRYYDSGENWPLINGYGALVAAYGASVPVSLNMPVTEIELAGKGVALATPGGTVRARAVIVTVSTNVLASGRIRFAHGLPAELQRALEGVPTGGANKIAFQFSRNVFDLPDTSYASFMDERDPARHAMSFQIRPFGKELAIAYFGGRFAEEMEAAGEAASIETARATLAEMFGTSILDHLVKTAATAWCGDPHTLGAYASALPGHAADRAALAEPVDGKLYLAGEAVHPTWFSTVQGAYLSGIDAMERVAASFNRCP
ncbi:MAG: FAD-dependent oxidoreductase [Parvibaculum sp.]|uniref:flavin monoamine oxidase family protein n=1 Tax=Parvibaculum sp. TaxID=2024848 RepID=UPI0025F79402|nr:NAD(P)/FAD-dependent oxidoreductase [Parvibaculum sp.]MCE9650821.1 FAD-dependent oxidoreductase [Parvibaculum sp.]